MKPTRVHALEWAREAGIRDTYVCGKPDQCPDDDGCCHHNTRDGVWVRDGQVEILVRRAYAEGQREMRERAAKEMSCGFAITGGAEGRAMAIRNLGIEE